MGLDSLLSRGCKLWKIRSCYVSCPFWPLKVWIMRFWRSVSGASDFEVSIATSLRRPADSQLQTEEVRWHSRTCESELRPNMAAVFFKTRVWSNANNIYTKERFIKRDSSILIPQESKQKSCYLMDLVCGRCRREQFGSCSEESNEHKHKPAKTGTARRHIKMSNAPVQYPQTESH